jgi:GAF domain-containing protein
LGLVDPLSLLWLFFILASLQPAFTRQWLLAQRRYALSRISRDRQATVITVIHRQESLSLLGFPVVRYIDIDDAEGVLRDGRSAVYPEVTDEMLIAGVKDPEQLALLRKIGMRSAMLVPMRLGERTIGSLTFVTAESGRMFTPEDLAFAEDLAQRAAVAVENARLYAAARRGG